MLLLHMDSEVSTALGSRLRFFQVLHSACRFALCCSSLKPPSLQILFSMHFVPELTNPGTADGHNHRHVTLQLCESTLQKPSGVLRAKVTFNDMRYGFDSASIRISEVETIELILPEHAHSANPLQEHHTDVAKLFGALIFAVETYRAGSAQTLPLHPDDHAEPTTIAMIDVDKLELRSLRTFIDRNAFGN